MGFLPETVCGRPAPRWRGVLVVIGAMLNAISMGIFYSIGNVGPYIISYMQSEGQDIDSDKYAWVGSSLTIGSGIMMPIGGFVARLLGPRITTLLGSGVLSATIFLTYFSVKMSFGMVIFTFGFMQGFSQGLNYVPPLVCVSKWFPEQRGLVSGLTLACIGVGSFALTPIQTAFVNPDNIAANDDGIFTDPDLIKRVPYIFLVMGASTLPFWIVGCLLITDPPESTTSTEIDNKPGDSDSVKSVDDKLVILDPMSQSLSPKKALLTREFVILWLSDFLLLAALNYLNSMYKIFGATFISNDHFLAMVGTVSAVFNSVGRVFWGVLRDVLGYKMCVLLIATIECFLLGTLTLTPRAGEAMFAVWIWSLYLTIEGLTVLLPQGAFVSFGPEYGGANYGFVKTANLLIGVYVAALSNRLTDLIDYLGIFCIFSAMAFIGMVMNMFFREYYHYVPPEIMKKRLVMKKSNEEVGNTQDRY